MFLQLVQLVRIAKILFIRSAKFSSHELVRSQFSSAILVDIISYTETCSYANCKLTPLLLMQKDKNYKYHALCNLVKTSLMGNKALFDTKTQESKYLCR